MTDQRDLAKEVEAIAAFDYWSSAPGEYQPDDGDVANTAIEHVNTLLAFIASQSRELEGLRRPVQSTQLDEIRSRQQARKLFISGGPGCSMGPEFTIGTITDDTDLLLSALDQAQREIARLSSPPEERGEIVERQRERQEDIETYGELSEAEDMRAVDDITVLLQDLRRYSNAHAILLAERDEARQSLRQESELHQARKDLVVQLTSERDEARGKCKTLEAESVEKQSALANWRDTAFRMSSKHATLERRMERLQGALKMVLALLVISDTGLSREQQAEVDVALAAADGQQKPWHCKEPCPSHICLAMSAEGMCGQDCATGDGVEGE